MRHRVARLAGAVAILVVGLGVPFVAATPATRSVPVQGSPSSESSLALGAASAPTVVQPVGPARSPRLSPSGEVDALRAAAAVPPTIVTNADGTVRSLYAKPGHPLRGAPNVPASAPPAVQARAFLGAHAAAFGLTDANRQLTPHRTDRLRSGTRIVRLRQNVGGVPIIAADLIVSLRPDGSVLSAGGRTTEEVADPGAVVSAAAAAMTAVRVVADRAKVGVGGVRADAPQAWMYDPQLIGARSRSPLHRVWWVDVHGLGLWHLVLVDARSGAVDLDIERQQRVTVKTCDENYRWLDTSKPSDYTCPNAAVPVALSYVEGASNPPVGPANGNDTQMAQLFAHTTYQFYKNRFNRNSINNGGMDIRSSVHVCDKSLSTPCNFQNAFWDGSQMVYGPGFATADDVVGHELTHGVTQYTSELFYAFQSGAINESMSDVFGEFIDQTDGLGTDTAGVKWLMGEDIPGGAIRSMANPPTYGQPDKTTSGLYQDPTDTNDLGGVHQNNGVGNKTAYLIADTATKTFNGQTITGIGIDKAAQIYYRTQNLLPSGAQYVDLGVTLQTACAQLLAENNPLPGSSGTVTITSGDCAVVDQAVAATELATPPAGQAAQIATVCAPSTTKVTLFSENFEGSTWPKFTLSGGWSGTPGAGIANFGPRLAHAGKRAAYGRSSGDKDSHGKLLPSGGYLTMATGVRIPTGSTTNLWFAHYDWFGGDQPDFRYYDGGVLEISADGGAYQDITASAVDGEQATTLDVPNGKPAFADFTPGYVSSRYDLSAYAGKTVKLRWGVTGNATNASYWALDDVSLYDCGGAAPTPPQLVQAPGTTATAATATVSWTAPIWGGASGLDHYVVHTVPAFPGGDVTVAAGVRTATLSRLDPATDYTVTVKAVATDASTATSASSTLLATTTTLDEGAGRPAGGHAFVGAVHLNGGSSGPLAGATVGIFGLTSSGVLTRLGTAITASDGTYAVTVTGTAYSAFIARYLGDATHRMSDTGVGRCFCDGDRPQPHGLPTPSPSP